MTEIQEIIYSHSSLSHIKASWTDDDDRVKCKYSVTYSTTKCKDEPMEEGKGHKEPYSARQKTRWHSSRLSATVETSDLTEWQEVEVHFSVHLPHHMAPHQHFLVAYLLGCAIKQNNKRFLLPWKFHKSYSGIKWIQLVSETSILYNAKSTV